MNADKLTADAAFDAGADLWILSKSQSASQSGWWQNIDFRTGFLLSHCLLFQKKEVSSRLEAILAETQIKKIDFSSPAKSLLLGTENHFFNKWILIVPDEITLAVSEINAACDLLKIHSIRLFSPSQALLEKISARLSTSLNRISFVE